MENNCVINNLKNVLECSTMTTYLKSLSSETEKLKWLQKALYFMISTGNYEDVFMYLLRGNDITFPHTYLTNQDVSEKAVQALFKNNYLNNGFLYHGTSKAVEDSILDNGLCSLDSRYGKEFINDIIRINSLCESISLNTKKYSLGKIELGNNLPLEFLKGKFDRVWVSAEMSQAYHYAYKNNSWLRTFISNLTIFLGGEVTYLNFDNIDILIDQIASAISKSKAIISNSEKEVFLDFIRKYSNELEMSNTLKNKALVLINNDIKLNQNYKNLIDQYNKNRGISYILSNLDSKELYCSSVSPSDLAVLTFNDDGSLTLKLGKEGR